MDCETSFAAARVLSRFFLEHSSEALFVFDDDGTEMFANRAARELVADASRPWSPDAPHDDALRAFWTELRAEGRAHVELPHPDSADNPRHLRVEGTSVDGTWVLVVREVTAARAVDEELRHLRRLESASLLSLSAMHDLGNLLTPIVYLAQGLANESEGDNWEPRAVAREIAAAADRASELCRRLLAFGRSSVPVSKRVNANEVIRGMSSLVERLLRAEITLELSLDERLDDIVADRGRLEHVLLNLVANARDAMPLGGRLTLRTENVLLDPQPWRPQSSAARGPFVAISVCDTGSGIRADLLDRVFDRFFTTKDARGGTGLGLAIARSFVAESGGLITVQSDVGQGTVVTLYLPRTPREG